MFRFLDITWPHCWSVIASRLPHMIGMNRAHCAVQGVCCCQFACRCQIAEMQVIVQRTTGYRRNNAEHCSLQSDKPESGCVKECCSFTRGLWMQPRLIISLCSCNLVEPPWSEFQICSLLHIPCPTTFSLCLFVSFFLSATIPPSLDWRDLHRNKRLSRLIAFARCCCTSASAPFGRVLKNVIPVNNEPIKIKYHW